MSTIEIKKAIGLNTQPNELDVAPGSLTIAENVEITRDGVIEVARGFEDYSTNLPDFTPEQLFVFDGVAYAHLDDGIWYNAGSGWLRKRGNSGAKSNELYFCTYDSGHIYYTSKHAVFDLNLSTGAISILAGRFNVTGSTNGTGGAARFNDLRGITSDGTNLYVCEVGNDCIRKIVKSTGVVTTFAGTAGATGSTDDIGTAARFLNPVGITNDGTNLYVCDFGNHTVRKIVISSAVVTTLAGTAGATGTTNATGSAARFNNPSGICYTGGNLYVTDYTNETIRAIVASSGAVTTLAGSAGVTGANDATGTSATFSSASDVCTDGTNLYLAEYGNDIVRKIVIATGVVTTLAGTAGSTGSTDAVGTAARFLNPRGITFDGTNLYVSEFGNDTIRKIYPNGYVTTISGVPTLSTPAFSATHADGIVVGPT